MKKKFLILAIIVIVVFGIIFIWGLVKKKTTFIVTNFEECFKYNGSVTESYPRQCRYKNQIFTEKIGNEFEKKDIIRIDYPRPNQTIESPLIITGEARGFWFFEASFPIFLTNWDGLIIAQGIATAKGDWMTENFVPFEAKLNLTADKNAYSNKGTLILRKDNPSGVPEHDDALEIPVIFSEISKNTSSSKICTQEVKQCPDGSYVGRTGPNCEFAQCF